MLFGRVCARTRARRTHTYRSVAAGPARPKGESQDFNKPLSPQSVGTSFRPACSSHPLEAIDSALDSCDSWLAPCTTIFCVRGHFVRACAPWSSKTGKKGSFSALRPPPSAFLAPAVRYAYSACIALPRCAKKIGLKSCSGDAVALGAFRQRSKHPRSAARRAVYCVRIYVITLNSMFTGCSWSRALQWCVICGARASAL